MSDNKWRFPASQHGDRNGISNGDREAFRKNPFKSFAREILQNSVDARDSDEEPTKVEFKPFELETDKIPGYEDLRNQIRRCKEFWAHKEDYVQEYEKFDDVLKQNKILCLRVSDFNTTGLVGVETDEQAKNKFLALAKGTGVSEKNSTQAGGSKGVGKNAAFNMSNISTVFYSTVTNQDLDGTPNIHKGSIGVADLVSGYVNDEIVEKRDYTQGKGYFSSDNENSPSSSLLNLDKAFDRNDRFGTDIYIIGFNIEDDWKIEVINSLLDSFMSTIVYGDLEVVVDDIEINKNTVKSIVYDESIIYKNNRSNIISQYRLLSGEGINVYDIETEYGSCPLYVLALDKNEEEIATHKCSMIRHPLMKIKDEPLPANFRVSAMCIIGEGKLGEILRSIENPQHIDWEPKRAKNKSLEKDLNNLLKDIRTQIKDRIIECLQIGNDKPIDPNGAGDFLPDIDVGESKNESGGIGKPTENVAISKPKVNETFEKNATTKSDNGSSLQPDIGSVDESKDGEVYHPEGHNDLDGGGHHPGPDKNGEKEGDDIIFKKYKLSGVRYKVLCVDKEKGLLKIIFIAPIDYENCYLNLSLLDDTNSPTPVEILEMSCNGKTIISEDRIEYGPFSITMNQKIVLNIKTDLQGYFGSEVKVICK